MKNEFVRITLIVVVAILAAIIFFRVVDVVFAAEEKPAQIEEYELTEQVEEVAVTTMITCVKETENELIDIPEEVVEEVEEVVELPKLYTHEDVIAMAKLLYGEAGGVGDLYIWDGRVISSEYQKACVVWTVLNRYDKGWEDSIIGVISAYQQFHGYDEDNPVLEELVLISYDVLERWNREQYGETDVGRVLPPEYLYFYGDMKHNYFMDDYGDYYKYNWDLEDPYI